MTAGVAVEHTPQDRKMWVRSVLRAVFSLFYPTRRASLIRYYLEWDTADCPIKNMPEA